MGASPQFFRLEPMKPAIRQLLFGSSAWTPAGLFRSGAQGAWYDCQDLSSMYQDSAGTTPAALEQPVGLRLDMRLGGVRGAELVTNGDFSNGTTGWSAGGGASHAASSGELIVTNTAGGGVEQSEQQVPFSIGQWYEITGVARKVAGTSAQVFVETNTLSLFASSAISSGTATPVRGIFFVPSGTTVMVVKLRANGLATQAGFDNVSIRPIPGNHATQTVPTSRGTLKQDATGRYYISYDGVDDGYMTGSIDFTATDKMTVFAGVTKNGTGMVAELSASVSANTGSFYLYSAASDFSTFVRGDGAAETGYSPGPAAAASSNVVTLLLDIAGATRAEEISPRLNGVLNQVGPQGAVNGGAGNFGSYPLYIGRRNNASLPFNGRDYGLVIVGKSLTATEIARTERWLASRAGITL